MESNKEVQIETQVLEFKSILKIRSGDKVFATLAVTCVALANARGGQIFIGYNDKTKSQEPGVKISDNEVNETMTKLRSRCFNVFMTASDVITNENGDQHFIINVSPSLKSIASTSDGKLYMRVGDKCEPVHGEDIQRLASEKQALQWELICTKQARLTDVPKKKFASFCDKIRRSPRVGDHIKQMTDWEIAENFNLVTDGYLTYLGILWLGNAAQRSRICYPITVQYIVYDKKEQKIRKVDWYDNLLDPEEMLLDIEKQAIELTYSYEYTNGLFRKQVRHYHPKVIRELLVNAFAHKLFSISGDIVIEVYPDRLEISNPGGLPLGVTADNILHQHQRRNPQFVRILQALELMEGEGSGYDLIYELDMRDSKYLPIVESDYNQTKVIQYATITNPELLQLFEYVSMNYELTQKNMITLGLVAQKQKLLTTELTKALQLTTDSRIRSYTDKLVEQKLLITRGTKKGTAFLINPRLIANAKINRITTLKTIEPYRLRALIEEDLKQHPGSKMAEILKRLPDADPKDIKKFVYQMVDEGALWHTGGKTYRAYHLNDGPQ